MTDPIKLFRDSALKKAINPKWAGQPHETFKHLGTTSKGDVGQEFIVEYAKTLGFEAHDNGRIGDVDVEIGGKKFEVKLASEDTAGSFQFNHIRMDYKYDFLICLGVTPTTLLFRIWNKADVLTDKAGTLVSMGRGQNSSFKLTKKKTDLFTIDTLQEELNTIFKT